MNTPTFDTDWDLYWERNDHPKWPFILVKPYTFPLLTPAKLCPGFDAWICYCGRRPIAVVEADRVTILSGYAWDGATGAPTFPRVLRSTLEHDVGCQFQGSQNFKNNVGNKAEVDRWFLRTMRDDRFFLRGLYYRATQLYGVVLGLTDQPCIGVVPGRKEDFCNVANS